MLHFFIKLLSFFDTKVNQKLIFTPSRFIIFILLNIFISQNLFAQADGDFDLMDLEIGNQMHIGKLIMEPLGLRQVHILGK